MKRLLTFAAILFLAGCAGQVHVTDTSGKPVQGAMIVPVMASINGETVRTDASGQASIPVMVPLADIKWLMISKAGYQEERVPIPSSWPLKVILVPSSK